MREKADQRKQKVGGREATKEGEDVREVEVVKKVLEVRVVSARQWSVQRME